MLTFEVPLVRVRMGKRVGFAGQPPSVPLQSKSKAAQTLALAHRVVRAVETGEVRDFSAAARRMGVSQARVSMLVALTFLAPEIQEEVLLNPGGRFRSKQLLRLARLATWEEQRFALRGTERDWGKMSQNRNPRAPSGRILARIPLETGGIYRSEGPGTEAKAYSGTPAEPDLKAEKP